MPKPPSRHQSLSPTRRFELRVRPEQPGLAWSATLEGAQCATLEGESHEHLEFSSPLELARFLADLSAEPDDKPALASANAPTGLR